MSRAFVDRRGTCGENKKSNKRGRKRVSDLSAGEDSSEEGQELVDLNYVSVDICKTGEMEQWKQSKFFSFYERGKPRCRVLDTDLHSGNGNSMFKIRDWPPDVSFQEKLTRHYQVCQSS